MLQANVRVVQRPDDAIDVSAHTDEQSVVGEALDGPLDFDADLDILHSQEGLLNDGRLQRQLHEVVDLVVPNDSARVDRADLPRTIFRDRVEVVIRDARDLLEGRISIHKLDQPP